MVISSRRSRHDDPGEGHWELAICSRFPILERRELPIGRIRADPAGLRSALQCTIDVHGTEVDVVGRARVVATVDARAGAPAPRRCGRSCRRAGEPRSSPATATSGARASWRCCRQWQRAVRGPTYPVAQAAQSDRPRARAGRRDACCRAKCLPQTPSDHRPMRARLRVEALLPAQVKRVRSANLARMPESVARAPRRGARTCRPASQLRSRAIPADRHLPRAPRRDDPQGAQGQVQEQRPWASRGRCSTRCCTSSSSTSRS